MRRTGAVNDKGVGMDSPKEHYKEVIKEFYADPVKAKVLNEFFERIFERGDLMKVLFVTPHGEVTVIREVKYT